MIPGKSVRLQSWQEAQLRRRAVQKYPNECCGFLLGEEDVRFKTVKNLIHVRNQEPESAQSRYLISPEAYLHAQREADQKGLAILGIYHSHPDALASPSEFDFEHAWPNMVYLILSVPNGNLGEMQAFGLDDHRTQFFTTELQIAS